MRGRVGGRIGTASPPSSYGASGMWRLADVYAAIRGSYGGGGFESPGGWPRNTISIEWPASGWPSYETVDYADATGTGTGTFDTRITVSPEGLSFTYFWEKSTDDGVTWATVSGSAGDDSMAGYYYSQRTVGLEVTSQTIANDGDLYRLVVNSGLKQLRSTPATMRYDTVSVSWSYHPANQIQSAGQTVYFYATGSLTGDTYGKTYNAGTLQWQRSTDGGATWADFGGTGSSLSFTVAAGDNNNRYRVAWTFGTQTFYSNSALLVVA